MKIISCFPPCGEGWAGVLFFHSATPPHTENGNMAWHHMTGPWSGITTCDTRDQYKNMTMHEEDVTCIDCLRILENERQILEEERKDNEEFRIWLQERNAKVKA